MRRPWFLWIGAITLMAGLTSCSTQTNPVAPAAPEGTGDGFLAIHDAKVVYSSPHQIQVTATIENHTDRLFYARLGDFYGGTQQIVLYAVSGSHAFLEQWDDASWHDLPRFMAFEGVRVVELRPHSTYTLSGGTPRAASDGGLGKAPDRFDGPPRIDRPAPATYRLKVQYFDDAATSPDQGHEDFSNTFVMRFTP